MAIRVVFFDPDIALWTSIVQSGAERIHKVSDEIGALDDSVEEYLNVVVLFPYWVWYIQQNIETFLKECSVLFWVTCIIHRILEKAQKRLNEDFVFIVILRKRRSENSWKVNFLVQ